MRLLLDNCVSGATGPELLALGYDVFSASSLERDPGDEELLRRAVSEERVLVTVDKDFGELVVLHGSAHRGIIRLVDIRARLHAAATHEAVMRYSVELAAGAIVTVMPGRVRIRLGGSA